MIKVVFFKHCDKYPAFFEKRCVYVATPFVHGIETVQLGATCNVRVSLLIHCRHCELLYSDYDVIWFMTEFGQRRQC